MTAPRRLLSALLTIVIMAGLAFDASAQDGLRSPVLPDRSPMQPLPQVPPSDLFRVPPDFYRQPPAPGPVPVWPGFGWPGYPVSPSVVVVHPDARQVGRLWRQDGYLRLDVMPLTTDVYIDGVFSGRAVDFDSDRGRRVRAGLRRIEFRPPGGRPARVALRVAAGETVVYGGTFESAMTSPPPVRPAPERRTFYVIAGCYAGDSEPDPARLPTGCRLDQVRSFQR